MAISFLRLRPMTARCAATWPFRDCAWKTADGAHDVVGLAPVAVAPGRQRRGIGSALIRAGHRRLVEQGESLVFVLGHPAYYTRFGYSLAAARAVPFRLFGPAFHGAAAETKARRSPARSAILRPSTDLG